MLGNLLKAAVGVVVAPVAVVGDTVMIPFDSVDYSKPEMYSRTSDVLKSVGNNINEAIK